MGWERKEKSISRCWRPDSLLIAEVKTVYPASNKVKGKDKPTLSSDIHMCSMACACLYSHTPHACTDIHVIYTCYFKIIGYFLKFWKYFKIIESMLSTWKYKRQSTFNGFINILIQGPQYWECYFVEIFNTKRQYIYWYISDIIRKSVLIPN